MKNFLFLLFVVLFQQSFFSQNILTNNTSNPNACDGAAYLMDSVIYQNWVWLNTDGVSVLQQGGTFVQNLCPGNYFLQVFENGVMTEYTFTIGSNLVDCSTFSVELEVIQYPSSPAATDGILASNVFGGTFPFVFVWNNGMTTQNGENLSTGFYEVCVTDANGCLTCSNVVLDVDTNTIDPCLDFFVSIQSNNSSNEVLNCNGSVTLTINGGLAPYLIDNTTSTTSNYSFTDLCPGNYSNFIQDANGCFAAINYIINLEIDTTFQGILNGNVLTTNVSFENNCDGSVLIQLSGGQQPYLLYNENGQQISQNLNNLCEGIYSVTVLDASGQNLVLNFFIASPNNIIDNNTFPDSLVLDTLNNGLIENCILDFTTIDTAFISNIEFISFDSLIVTWSIIDGNGTIEILEDYALTEGLGVYELLLEIFCPQRASDNYLIVKQQFRINGIFNNLTENNKNQVLVYPNPFVDELTIEFQENLNNFLQMTDISGKIVFEETISTGKATISTSQLPKGYYVLTVENESGKIVKKLVK